MIAISPARLRSRVEALARFGALPGGGVTRPCWSPQHEKARAWLLEEIRAAGLEPWVDPAGNVFGGLGARAFAADAPVVLTGSHIDTVPEGGILDGALGVLAGLEALQAIREANAARRLPLAVAAWSDEEGRYGSLFGSRALSAYSAAARKPSRRRSIGVVPAWSAWPLKTIFERRTPTIEVTTPIGIPPSSSRGPCSMCSST